MELSTIDKIKTALHQYESNYHTMVFRNTGSLVTLKEMYQELDQFRNTLIEDFPHFPPDPVNTSIINEMEILIKDTGNKREKQEWHFYHYNDLFIFRVSELLVTMDLVLT